MQGLYPLSANELFDALRSDEYITALTKKNKGENININILNDSDSLYEVEISWLEPERGSAKATEKVIETQRWDKTGLSMSFSRKMPAKPYVKTTGAKKIEVQSEASAKLMVEGDIDIAVPILGKKIAKKIAASLEKNWEKNMQWDIDFLNSQS